MAPRSAVDHDCRGRQAGWPLLEHSHSRCGLALPFRVSRLADHHRQVRQDDRCPGYLTFDPSWPHNPDERCLPNIRRNINRTSAFQGIWLLNAEVFFRPPETGWLPCMIAQTSQPFRCTTAVWRATQLHRNRPLLRAAGKDLTMFQKMPPNL